MPTAPLTAMSPAPSAGARLVATDGRPLVLAATTLEAEARAGVARVVVVQRFTNPWREPLAVTYALPLPADGAVAGFEFTLGERRVVGEIDRRAAARERFERAILEGRTAALVEQERTSVFTQQIGIVLPRTDVVVRITVDQPLAWRDEGAWEWRFPTVVAPRYLGESGRVPDGERVMVDVAATTPPATLAVRLAIGDRLAAGGWVASPTHSLDVTAGTAGTMVALADGRVVADRDVVVRWPVAERAVGFDVATARPPAGSPGSDVAYGLVTITPPRPGAAPSPAPRDLIVLLDTSGSMDGRPLEHAKMLVRAMLAHLGGADTLELITFGSQPVRWTWRPVRATGWTRRAAARWIDARIAAGGTEMLTAVEEALAPLDGGGQRQVVLVTDGAIGFETEVVSRVLASLPPRARLHVAGVGDAVNRALTAPLARAGRGVEVVVGLDDDAAAAAARLVAHTAAPLATDVTLAGDALLETVPARLPDVHAGAPLRASVRLRPDGGTLVVSARVGGTPWKTTVSVPPVEPDTGAPGIVTRFAREAVEELELHAAAGERVDGTIERLALAFRIATRVTSWVAVSETPTVDPGEPIRRERVAHALPHGMSAEGLGLAPPWAARVAIPRTYHATQFALGRTAPPAPLREAISGSIKGRPASVPFTRVTGRATWLADGTLVIEIAVGGTPLVLDAHPVIVIRAADGTHARVALDPARSTRPGTHAPGQVVRLVVIGADRRTAATPIQLELGDGTGFPALVVVC